jgi:hypothetical protein
MSFEDSLYPVPDLLVIRLTTSPKFSRFAKRVREAGGTYSKCRGENWYRHVTLPWNADGHRLAKSLISELGFDETTVTLCFNGGFRGRPIPSSAAAFFVKKDDQDPICTLCQKFCDAICEAFPGTREIANSPPVGFEKKVAFRIPAIVSIDDSPQAVNVGRRHERHEDSLRYQVFGDTYTDWVHKSRLFATECEAWEAIAKRLHEVSELYAAARERALKNHYDLGGDVP